MTTPNDLSGPQQPLTPPPTGATGNQEGQALFNAPPAFGAPAVPQPKRGFPVKSVVRIAVPLLLLGGYGLYHYATSAHRDSNGNITNSGSLSVSDLRVGDCFNAAVANGSGTVSFATVTAVPCTQAHQGQVVGTADMTDSSYPSDSVLQAEAGTACDPYFKKIDRSSVPNDAATAFLFPDSASFDQGSKTISCLVQSDSKGLTGSVLK